ncbi:GNAT family N-acetyltransferase [Roseomonas sp. CCTCC AB2023176]|uniref:GNAT family N-acetyltransferase n=1 Tax=Roseomonas sp. CCTCC AB2023176 TaxID=3342640 RepID=UPI0035D9ED18
MAVETDISAVASFVQLGREWQELERRAEPSFFQTWTWVGCLAEERFPDPVLIRASDGGVTVGLALLNRRRGRLWLGESGDPALDAPFVEHNGPLVVRGRADVEAALLSAAWRVRGAARLVLSGVRSDLLRATGGVAWRHQVRAAPFVDLAGLRSRGGDWLETRSANTRAQIRRSRRFYEGRYGPVSLTRPATEGEALRFLRALIELHGVTWRRRGREGAFATGFLRRFHENLVIRAGCAGQLDLQRHAAGDQVIGYLYNFRQGRRLLSYQSGFLRDWEDGPAKPGLTCHEAAIRDGIVSGLEVYDFLAGDQRYKKSLAAGLDYLHWFEIVPRRSISAFMRMFMRID